MVVIFVPSFCDKIQQFVSVDLHYGAYIFLLAVICCAVLTYFCIMLCCCIAAALTTGIEVTSVVGFPDSSSKSE